MKSLYEFASMREQFFPYILSISCHHLYKNERNYSKNAV